MSSRVPTLRGLFAAGLILAAGSMNAQLATKSPFVSTQAGNSSAPTAGAPLEYRGMMQTASGLKARIVDPSRHNAGVWLGINEKDSGFDAVVKSIDIDHDTVSIDFQGRTMTLAQHVAKVASAGTAQNFIPQAPNLAANMPAAIANSVVVNPTPADEQRRLEAVAAEVARRRQLREQASQQVTQGVPIAPQVIQQQQQQRQNANPQLRPNNGSLPQQRGAANQRPRSN